jgi:hypothetical protein
MLKHRSEEKSAFQWLHLLAAKDYEEQKSKVQWSHLLKARERKRRTEVLLLGRCET